MTLSANDLVWEFLSGRVASGVPAANVLKMLQKMASKTKGMFNAALVRGCFNLMPGWTMDDTKVASQLNGSGSDIPKEMLKSWASKNKVRILGALSKKEPFEFIVEDASQADRAMKELDRLLTVTSKSGPGTNVKVGTLYGMKPGNAEPYWNGKAVKFRVDRMWLGLPGWNFAAPTGQMITLPNPVNRNGRVQNADEGVKLARFWTWAYKNGLDRDAKKTLDSFDQEDLDHQTSGRAKHDQVQQQYSAEVEKLLEKLVSKKHKEVVAELTKANVEALDRYMAVHDAAIKEQRDKGNEWPTFNDYSYFKSRPTESRFKSVIRRMVERVPETIQDEYQRKSDWKKTAKEDAERTASELRAGFVSKNTFKLGRIVNTKQGLKDAKILSINSGPDYGGELMFSFNDGSSFTVRNKTVVKQNMHGTVFAQYPTTFHDVKLPDGSKMSSPSEKRMVEVFATA